MKKKRRVPEVLWRLYRNHARTLADTIVSLMPPPPSSVAECRCKGRLCIGCSGADAMSFLLRSDDPPDYRKLLIRCFAVVSDNAPGLLEVYPDRRWSQQQIVRRTIEMIMCEQPTSSNVICNGYNKCNHSSPIVDLLTSSAWGLLLKRIGDNAMVYLLKFTSIFLPLPRGKHYQVVGPPISGLCLFSKNIAGSEYQQPSTVLFGPPKKRKRVDNEDKSAPDDITSSQQLNSSLGVDSPFGSVSRCVGCLRPFVRQCWRKHRQMSFSEANMPNVCTGIARDKEDPDGELQQSSNEATTRPRKHLRPFSWQRRRNRRKLNLQEDNLLNCSTTIYNDNQDLSGKLQQSSNTSLNHQPEKMLPSQEPEKQYTLQVESELMTSQCFCCLIFQAPQKVAKGALINRQFMFYKSGSSSSVFPRNHILYTLKPNLAGANLLMRDIFGLSDGNLSAQSMPCFHSRGSCLIGSACLYHSLVKLLKSLIRKAHGCQHLKLLDKHCAVPSLDRSAGGNVGFMFEGNESQTKLLEKGHAGVLLESIQPLDKSHGVDTKHRNKTLKAFYHQFEMNDGYCLKSQVVSFIWAVCRSIVPPDLLGAPSNWRALRRNISKFVHLRRFEKFSLKQCMQGLKTSSIPLLSNKHSLCHLSNHVLKDLLGKGSEMSKACNKLNNDKIMLRHKIFESWIFWFFTCLIVPIVHANFYVTETELGKQAIFYYRKSIWEKLTDKAMSCFKDQSYHLLDGTSFRNIVSKRSFGFSNVRLRPKGNGVRALANLKAPSRVPVQGSSLKNLSCGMQKQARMHWKRVKFDYFKSVNYVLRDLHLVLKGVRMKHPEKLGSSVFDYNEVYRRLCPFLIGLKNGSTTMPSVFVVICDVSKAFDSIDQDKLLTVMKDVILNDEYLLKQSSQVVCTQKSLWVHYDMILSDQNLSTGTPKCTASVPSRSLHSVLVNEERIRNITKEELYHSLYEHVKRNVLQLGRNFYLQEVGIAQGSVLSSLLCSFYYGHLERNVIFPFLKKNHELTKGDLSGKQTCQNASSAQSISKDGIISSFPKHMLLRFIDDFLFISTSKMQAASFFSRLQRGFREYNCSMNEEKFCLNFDIGHKSDLSSKKLYRGEDGIPFLRWSGLLINCYTLEIQADYTRYLNSTLSSTLTVCWQGKPGRLLKEKLCDYMRPKCHPIFYDSNINSAAIVRLNIYQAFLLCAMKFHCYVCDLTNVCTLRAEYYLEIIQRSLGYMHKLIKKRMHSMNLGCNFYPILQLEKEEVEWLGLNAYIRVLKRKQSRHKGLLSFLRSNLLAQRILESTSSQLKYAVDDSHSSVFWKIKY